MASVLPLRPNTNSSGTTSNGSGGTRHTRRPSLTSLLSSKRSGSGSQSTQDDATKLSIHGHAHTHSSASNPSSAQSYHSSLPSIHDQQQQAAITPGTPGVGVGARSGATNVPRQWRHQAHQKAVKSQYPADSDEKHVEYILVASFDIDRGSVMEHQYPGPVGGDEHMLAELMLPDQAHVRAQDWTMFFLHKDAGGEGEGEGEGEGQAPKTKKRRRRREDGEQAESGAEGDGRSEDGAEESDEKSEDTSAEEQEGDDEDEDIDHIDGPPLVYVLNLVNTKHDTTTRRGAIVKAMAICTRHSFLHIYKPLLLLALQQYFANPVVETLASLYDAVNAMDLSLMPRLSWHEKFILQSSDAKDLFLERFETIIAQHMEERERLKTEDGALSPPSPTAQPLPTRGRYGLPRDTHEFESVVKYANVPVPVKVPVALSPETVGDFSLVKLITTFATPHSSSPVPFSPTHPHLTTNGALTHPIIVLLNALLTQKRVIFLGHNLPSSDVAEAVLGACALASGGLLRGFTRHAFPYTDLTKIDDLLKVPGFIAGVTNPAFAHKTEWWDLLCDISTGRMRISNRVEQAPLTEGVVFFHQQNGGGHAPGGALNPAGGISALAAAGASLSAGLGGNTLPTGSMSGDATGDVVFMANVISAINERHGENAIRAKFRRWVLKFTRLAASFEEMVYGASALHIHAPTTGSSPKVGLDSPVSPSANKKTTPQQQQQQQDNAFAIPPEVAGHGYVWSTAQAKKTELAANATRIEGWRNTRSYYNFIQDLAAFYVHRPVKELDLQHLHDKLSKLRLGPDQSANLYLAICAAVNTDAEISELLSVVCSGTSWQQVQAAQQQQGLFYLALGLFHPKCEVREQVAELLLRVQEHEAGRHFWGGLGRFARMGWERVLQGREARLVGGQEVEGG